jgi:hypothetical protein
MRQPIQQAEAVKGSIDVGMDSWNLKDLGIEA